MFFINLAKNKSCEAQESNSHERLDVEVSDSADTLQVISNLSGNYFYY